ncbi:MAG: integrase, partial [Ligilactobacillus agilis]|nr:integrase [Ligilactobacillus agilis]
MQRVEADNIVREMLPYLNNQQLIYLKGILNRFTEASFVENSPKDNKSLLERYFAAKRAEGCSEKSLNYYQATLIKALDTIDKNATEIM